jgi:glycosyltransferase involved in cell wall biosynthesis
MTTVSVLLATCNGAPFLQAQLDSICRQTLAPHELWIADDGSTDETLRIVSAFAVRAPFPVRIRVNTEPQGHSDNFLSAAALCEGDFIALADQDDEWHPEKLERCVTALVREDALLCAHAATLIDEDSRYIGYLGQGIDTTAAHDCLTLPPWGGFLDMTQVFRRELLSWIDFRLRGPDDQIAGGAMTHDRWIYFLAQSLGRVVTLSHPLAGHRQQRTAPERSPRARLVRSRPGQRFRTDALLERRHAAALHRWTLLAELALKRPKRPLAERARLAAMYWGDQWDVYGLRKTIHQAPRFAERRAALSRLLDLGSYSGDRQSMFGGAELANDLVRGVLRLPFGWTGRWRAPVVALSPRQRPGVTPADS